MNYNAITPLIKGKGLNESLTIPKRNFPDSDILVHSNFMHTTHAFQAGVRLANWSGQQNNLATYCQYPSYSQYNTNCEMDTSQSNNALKRTREEPKTTKADVTYRDSYTEINDPTLPKELKVMFQPLYCKLCLAQLSSNVMAKMHYKSKNHEKKVRRFLIDYSEKTGEPLHKRAKVTKAQPETEEYNPKYFHCDVCDLPLTGKIHAESHYMGKNHQKVVMGKKPPAGKGHYNNEGKWVRTTLTKADTSGHDSFGVDFIASKPVVEVVKLNTKPERSLHCDLCNVSVTSMPQMEMHLQGQKHWKKMKQLQVGGVSPTMFNSEAIAHDDKGEAASAVKGNHVDLLCSYRTPSGQYYCKTCNLSLNSETQFMQHLNSKKHLKKGNLKD